MLVFAQNWAGIHERSNEQRQIEADDHVLMSPTNEHLCDCRQCHSQTISDHFKKNIKQGHHCIVLGSFVNEDFQSEY